MKNNEYAVAIIGGGLAGLSLAIQCANENVSVVLIEKESYPYHKVCGEYISLESKPFLASLGIKLNDLQLPTIDTLCITNHKGRPYRFKLPLGGFGVSRYTLDNLLYQIALQKGADIFTNTKVNEVIYNAEYDNFKIITSEKEIFAKVAIGAFGKRSNIDIKYNRTFTQDKTNKINNFVGVKYHIKYKHPENVIAIHNFPNGYCGMSKIENNTSCLCYLTTQDNLKTCNNSIDELEKKILGSNPKLKHILENSVKLYEEPKVIAQVSFMSKTQVDNHVIMLGDAAGLITPICGNGMSIALHTSKITFQLLCTFFAGEINRQQLEKNYISIWNKNFKYRLMAGRYVHEILNNRFISHLALHTLSKSTFLSDKVISLTHGQPF